MDQPIITRAEAKAAGLTRYFTGKPCKHGHVAERLTSNKGCLTCDKKSIRRATYYTKNKDEICARKAEYSKQNPEKIKETAAASYARNIEKRRAEARAAHHRNKDEVRARKAAYYAKNRDEILASKAAYYARNAEEIKAARKTYVNTNPEKIITHNRNRKAKKKAADGFHTKADIQRIHAAQGGKCAICRKKLEPNFHVDHIKPLSKGGSNWPSNLQVACGPCNTRKRDRDPIDHMRSLGMLL